jgi:hypothetical protein
VECVKYILAIADVPGPDKVHTGTRERIQLNEGGGERRESPPKVHAYYDLGTPFYSNNRNTNRSSEMRSLTKAK